MKRLERGEPPVYLEPATVKGWYADLRDKGGEIRDRWNARVANGRPVRDPLEQLSDGCCAWCGKKLETGWPVDHYLPQAHFPRLSYHWNNLLPSCETCNKVRKKDYFPTQLAKDSLTDPILELPTPYEPTALLPSIKDRLVDPSSEDPAAHLVFQPEAHGYKPTDPAPDSTGTRTIRTFFPDKTFGEAMEKLSTIVRILVSIPGAEAAISPLIEKDGQEFYYHAYTAYWRSFFPDSLEAR
jgi:uncharacterized protein (TIGR02646 family)